MTKQHYILFLDDERTIDMVDQRSWPRLPVVIARSSEEAQMTVINHGDPTFCSFDHDLGGDDTTMKFLRWYAYQYQTSWNTTIPEYVVHSANPVGAKNIVAFMESWKRSLELP